MILTFSKSVIKVFLFVVKRGSKKSGWIMVQREFTELTDFVKYKKMKPSTSNVVIHNIFLFNNKLKYVTLTLSYSKYNDMNFWKTIPNDPHIKAKRKSRLYRTE